MEGLKKRETRADGAPGIFLGKVKKFFSHLFFSRFFKTRGPKKHYPKLFLGGGFWCSNFLLGGGKKTLWEGAKFKPKIIFGSNLGGDINFFLLDG